MKKAIINNILYSIVEKFFLLGSQFLITVLLVRLLPRQDYGVIGVVTGYFAFVNIINISLESIILRDHKIFDLKIEKYIYNFFVFNIIKSIFFILIALILSALLVNIFSNANFLYSIWSITVIYIADALTAPLVIYQSAKLNQKTVTKISLIRAFLNLIILLGLFYFPSLKYILIKDIFVSFTYVSIWLIITVKFINIKNIKIIEDIDFHFLKNTLLDYSLWTHLNGVVTNFIYRSDTFFLSFFVGLTTIGNYNIALNSANVANILPMILGYQNSVALSHAKNDKQAFSVSNAFVRFSFYINIFSFAVFYFFGNFYLYLITGLQENREVYTYMIYIVLGIIISKGITSPLIAYINIRGSVKSLFFNVLIVLSVITFIIYYFSAKFFGAYGISVSNIFVSVLWVTLLIREVKKYEYEFRGLFNLKSDFLLMRDFLVER